MDFSEFFKNICSTPFLVIVTCLLCLLFKEYKGIEHHEFGLNPGWYVVIIILILFLYKQNSKNKDKSINFLD